jgi:glycosyltransferase involved in cell wall biosynthesis
MHVTVVIPNHNYGHWILDALNSVAFQETQHELNVVVIDDGSTDDSYSKLMRESNCIQKEESLAAGAFKGIPLTIKHFDESRGPSFARNWGILATRNQTDAYAFLDADDIFLSKRIERCVNKLLSSKHIGVVYSDYTTIDESTGIATRVFKEPFSRTRLQQECIVHSACVVRTKTLFEAGLYDEEMRTCEDYDLWMRLSEKCMFVHIPESLMFVRVGNYNSTSTVDKSIWENNLKRVHQKAQLRRGKS